MEAGLLARRLGTLLRQSIPDERQREASIIPFSQCEYEEMNVCIVLISLHGTGGYIVRDLGRKAMCMVSVLPRLLR